MKLIKVYVENFGKLHCYEHSFNENFNEIVENNGWGKSTLATFIKAMFYGLNKTKTSKLSENERKKFMPWQGGNMGGYIDFEWNGNCYRIERFFGKKETEDSLKVLDLKTGKTTDKLGENIGEKLFELDSEGYARSTFIPQKELPSGINESISSKLINLIQGTDSKDSYEKAVAIIDERRMFLKKKGGGGEIARVEEQMAGVAEKIDNLKREDEAITQIQNYIDLSDKKLEEFEEKKAKIDEKIAKYGELKERIANKRYIEENREKREQLLAKRDKLNEFLNGNNPSEQEIKEISKRINNLFELETSLQTLDNSLVADKTEEIKRFFNGNIPQEEKIKEQIKNVEKIKFLEEEIVRLQEDKRQPEEKKQNKFLTILPLIICVLCIATGGVLIALKFNIPSIACFVVAIIALFIGGFLYFKNYIEKKTANFPQSGNLFEIEKKQSEKQSLQQEINNFVRPYEARENIVDFLYDLGKKVNEYNRLNEEKERINNEKIVANDKISLLDQELKQYFSNYKFLDEGYDYSEKLSKIMLSQSELSDSSEELDCIDKKLASFKDFQIGDEIENIDITALQKEMQLLQGEIDDEKAKKSGYTHKIDDIREELSALDDLENLYDELKSQLDKLKTELKMITQATKFLTEANDNLSSKYLKPMQEGLNKYLKIILQESYQKLNIDTSINVSLEINGQSREIDYLSKGYQGVIDLCIRFALIDTLFTKEKPFIILDDPFVNMDKDKLENVLKLIKEVSKEYQIVYFICHNSRSCDKI